MAQLALTCATWACRIDHACRSVARELRADSVHIAPSQRENLAEPEPGHARRSHQHAVKSTEDRIVLAAVGEGLKLREREVTDIGAARLPRTVNRSDWIRRKTLRLFATQPALYSKMMSVHTGASPADSLRVREILGLSVRVLAA